MKEAGKQTEAKARRFRAGLVAALAVVAAVLAALGACGEGWSGRDAPPPPKRLRLDIKTGMSLA
ncbi:MAG: hypothetical protein LBF60_03695 [Treponema sp.]|jgi:hypothetical protein|nr:hypothetical protein [Treponema sp.]